MFTSLLAVARRSRRNASLLLILPGLAWSCSGIDQRDPIGSAEALAPRTTYAWSDASDTAAPQRDTAPVLAALRTLVDQRLQSAGFRTAAAQNAQMRVQAEIQTEEVVREMDPYFSYDTVRRIERGRIGLTFVDASTKDVLWNTVTERTLRDLARGSGPLDVRWEDLDQARDWKLELMVERLLSELPAENSRAR